MNGSRDSLEWREPGRLDATVDGIECQMEVAVIGDERRVVFVAPPGTTYEQRSQIDIAEAARPALVEACPDEWVTDFWVLGPDSVIANGRIAIETNGLWMCLPLFPSLRRLLLSHPEAPPRVREGVLAREPEHPADRQPPERQEPERVEPDYPGLGMAPDLAIDQFGQLGRRPR